MKISDTYLVSNKKRNLNLKSFCCTLRQKGMQFYFLINLNKISKLSYEKN